jgi:hypothetical protein
MYAAGPMGVDLVESLYALDSTTADLCLSLFPWAKFRKHKGAVKMHTLLDLHGNIPSFIHIADGKVADVRTLDEILPEPGALYVMDRGYVDFERRVARPSPRCIKGCRTLAPPSVLGWGLLLPRTGGLPVCQVCGAVVALDL